MTARPVILDVDTGTDDAVAIMMAALRPELDLLAVTTVWGNIDVAHTTDNTLRVLDYINCSSVPVYAGLDAPVGRINVPLPQTSDRSGGLMHPEALDLPEARSTAMTQGAVEWLVETLRARTTPVTLVPVGTLSNIAAALTVDPTIVEAVDEIVIMGGGNALGNVTASAESNIWKDPIAADIVFTAGFERLVLVPLDATHQAQVSMDQARALRDSGSPAGTATAICVEQRVRAHVESQPQADPNAAPLHDALCVAYLLDPEVIPLTHCHTGIETTGLRTYGRTVIDYLHRGFEEPNSWVALSADAPRFNLILHDSLTRIA